ncbi:argininosuccinate lyase [Campylobacter corcagiensis]|uniref:Argininosuccinate lyase n=1 Tax=Campylobacter corcagiensis TaxID=1448857 RepID=A0A7M1LFR6_9BACT|nr:argininosuccinate lyase [Campylobacter corcagiensis]QKF64374.1 argininosuccinate lyase [Campylobacter corcagiensis]QOQ87439.1 argininosuccinate lyase [Campylobacter corcagiensis]
MTENKKLWGGRFTQEASKLLEEFNASIGFDKNLYKFDIKGSIAHAKMLAKQGILSNYEKDQICKGLEQISSEIDSGSFEFKISDEDIHMAIESRLSEIIGKDIGGKLHTARSRNDQVAVDFRQYVMSANLEISTLIKELMKTLTNIAKDHLNTLMPGFTHLQHAQPVSLAYHLMAYSFMFMRDYERFISSFERNNFSPLGSAALAGTPHNIDREFTALELGFKAPTFNAMDSVSDRDFALEILFNISVLFMHTSRISEELVLWSSSEFGFVTMSDKFSTGSSIMPQKKNPDVAELIRGKTGRVYGNLVGLLTVMKSLPLAYNKDTQEDKEGVFDSVNSAKNSLVILNEMLKTTKFNSSNMLKACQKGHLTATDLADYLVSKKGTPFRKAHHIVGECVAKAEEMGLDLSQMSLDELSKIDKNIDNTKVLSLENSKETRNSYGGTANSSVLKQIEILEEFLG